MKKFLTPLLAILVIALIVVSAVFASQKAELQKKVDELSAQVAALTNDFEAAKAAEAAAKAEAEAAKAEAEAAKVTPAPTVAPTATPAEPKADEVSYTYLYSSEVTTLNYLVTSSTNEFAIAANIIDTLVEYDMYGRVQPSLALSWENTNNGLTWTFKLRQDATWVNGKGEVVANVTANDFVAAAKYILDAKNASSTANILYGVIEGAKAYYDGTAIPEEGAEPAPVMPWDTVGIKALDEYTLEYTLSKPVPYFLSMVTYVNFMPVYEPFLNEKGADFGIATDNESLLYCGAYYLSEFKPQQIRVMSKNPANWDKDNVHIDRLVAKYNKEASTVSPTMYLNGEIDSASLSTELTADWLMDEKKAGMIHPARVTTNYYSYFYTFNFDPQFDAMHEPENWKVAVNNENFRLSIVNAFNRIKAKTLIDADNPETLLYNTITPPTFSEVNGVDYINIGELAAISSKDVDTLNVSAALQYKEAAVKELEGKAKFPVKVLLLYNPNSSAGNSAEEAQIVEQQLEGVLGADYVDVVIESGPATSYLTARRTGMYGMMNCNWGPDYADPETYTDPFAKDSKYSFIFKSTDTESIDEYYALVEAAKAITDDIPARYEAFAKAEAYLINHGYVIPFGYGTGGYTASLLDPFSAPIAPFGITTDRYKGQYKLEDYMDIDEYYDAMDAYEAARDAALSE
ncbi:MAG: peptide ABC transporter substrate-binding protein [Clostridia bacterium]|nr:peptide ABC transporter substrate-binding protein [Clostridia bacterium]